MEKPQVSVIMPVYNGEKYIGKAIESVLAQNVPTELLVIDDCSTDKTELTVMKYMDSGNIRYIRNKENMGAARSRNRGVKASKGKYIAFLDADDWWEEGKLAAQLAPQGVPIIEVYNKADLVEPQLIPVGENKVAISAATGTGLPRLLELVEQNLDTGVRRVTMKLPYSSAGEVDRIHREGKVFTTEYENDGILVEAALSREMQGRYRDYILS